MKKYVVAGNSLRDVQNGVKALEDAIRRGHTHGVGASTLGEMDEAYEVRARLFGTPSAPAPTTTPCQTDPLEALEDLDMEAMAEELAEDLIDTIADVCAPLVELADRCDAPLRDILTNRLTDTLPDLLSGVIQQCCDN